MTAQHPDHRGIQKRRKAWADRHGKHKIFSKGDSVLVFNSKLGKHPDKLKLRWTGPFTINEEIAPGTFSLKNLDGTVQLANVNGCDSGLITRKTTRRWN